MSDDIKKPATNAIEPSTLLAGFGMTIQELSKSLKILSDIAKKVEFPPFEEIKKMRLEKLRSEYGTTRFFLAEYWRWKPNRVIDGK